MGITRWNEFGIKSFELFSDLWSCDFELSNLELGVIQNSKLVIQNRSSVGARTIPNS